MRRQNSRGASFVFYFVSLGSPKTHSAQLILVGVLLTPAWVLNSSPYPEGACVMDTSSSPQSPQLCQHPPHGHKPSPSPVVSQVCKLLAELGAPPYGRWRSLVHPAPASGGSASSCSRCRSMVSSRLVARCHTRIASVAAGLQPDSRYQSESM